MGELKEKIFTIEFPVFDYELVVILSSDVMKSRTDRDEEVGEKFTGEPALALHSYNYHNPIAFLIFNEHDVTPGVIAHEASHAVYRLLEWIGATERDEEVLAYHIEYIVDKVWNFVKKQERETCQADLTGQPGQLVGVDWDNITSLPNFEDC